MAGKEGRKSAIASSAGSTGLKFLYDYFFPFQATAFMYSLPSWLLFRCCNLFPVVIFPLAIQETEPGLFHSVLSLPFFLPFPSTPGTFCGMISQARLGLHRN